MATYKFNFNNEAVNLTPATQQMLDFIAQNLPAQVETDTVLFKAKYILTELLTNSLKHSGANGAELSVSITDTQLQIVKSDTGKLLPLINETFTAAGNKVPLTRDMMHQLYAQWIDGSGVRFICEENNFETIEITQVPEHFGLLIITKTADVFTYHYREPTNVFSVIINLN